MRSTRDTMLLLQSVTNRTTLEDVSHALTSCAMVHDIVVGAGACLRMQHQTVTSVKIKWTIATQASRKHQQLQYKGSIVPTTTILNKEPYILPHHHLTFLFGEI